MARTNFLLNPSFEVDAANWAVAGVTLTRGTTTRPGVVGGFIGILNVPPGASGSPFAAGIAAPAIVTPGQWVAVGLRAGRSTGSAHARIGIQWFAGSTALSVSLGPVDVLPGAGLAVYTAVAQAPATATTARLLVFPVADASGGTPPPAGNTFIDAGILVVRATQADAAAAVTPYFDGSFPVNPDWTYSWSGTAHASTSLETPTPGLYVVPVLGDPCPRVEITLTGLDPVGPSRVTVWRSTVGGKRRAVRGWKNRLVFGSDIGIDYEAPLGREIRYDLQVISGAGTPLRVTATCTLAATEGLIQDPLVPSSNVPLVDFSGSGIPTPTLAPSAFRKLTYDMGSSQERVLGSDTPVGFAGQRMVASGVDFSTLTDSAEQGTALRNLLMTAYPILVRPLPEWGDLPDLLYLDVPQPVEEPLNAHTGGTLTRWTLAGDQVTPPSLSVVVPLWTYDQVQDLFAAYTYAYRESLAVGINATYMDDQRDPTLGG